MSEVAMLSQMLAEEIQERADEVETLNARIARLEKDLKASHAQSTMHKVAEARALGELEGVKQALARADEALKAEKAKPAKTTIQAAPGAPEYELQVTARDGNDRIRSVSLIPVKTKGKP